MNNSAPIAPDFSLPGHDGKHYTLSLFRGQWVILYFYPKDNTPGCTQEACDFRDNYTILAQHNCVVFGISKDSLESHAKFHNQFGLNFTLLSDIDRTVHQAYGALDENKIRRSTFLIDPNGYLVKSWLNVKVKGHVNEILNSLQSSV